MPWLLPTSRKVFLGKSICALMTQLNSCNSWLLRIFTRWNWAFLQSASSNVSSKRFSLMMCNHIGCIYTDCLKCVYRLLRIFVLFNWADFPEGRHSYQPHWKVWEFQINTFLQWEFLNNDILQFLVLIILHFYIFLHFTFLHFTFYNFAFYNFAVLIMTFHNWPNVVWRREILQAGIARRNCLRWH